MLFFGKDPWPCCSGLASILFLSIVFESGNKNIYRAQGSALVCWEYHTEAGDFGAVKRIADVPYQSIER